jgi:hypothetical protein
MAYNALLQTLPSQNSASFSTPFSAPFSAAAAGVPTSISPPTSATMSTIASASKYEYMPLLKRGDYLQVRFWDKSSFSNSLSGKGATTFGLSSNSAKTETTDYLEDENSTPLTEQQRGAMYSHARRFWNTYLQKSGRFPPTYSALDLDTLGHFRSEMERHFFELRLCDNHWKADEIWIRNYHSWRSSAERQPGIVKTEVSVCDDSDPVAKKERPRPRKRKRGRSPSIPAKKTDQSTTNDAEFAPFDSDPQVMASSASDARNSMPPTSHSSVSHISVDASPILSSVAIESDAPALVTAPLPTMITATPLGSVEHPPLLDVAGLVSEHRHVRTEYTPVSESATAEPGMASPTLSHPLPEQTMSMRVSPCRSVAQHTHVAVSVFETPITKPDEVPTEEGMEGDTVSLLPVSNNSALESDTLIPVVSNDSRPLPAGSYPPSKSQPSADNETLLAALSLSLLAQPVHGKSHQSHCRMV